MTTQRQNFKVRNQFRFYRGLSMSGTFQPGDLLQIEAIDFVAIRPGDVVVFRGSNHRERKVETDATDDENNLGETHILQEEQPVNELVHRVIAISKNGLITRGDNNLQPDPEVVNPANLIGKVTAVERDMKRFSIMGDWAGLWWARILRVWKFQLQPSLVRIGRRPYRWLDAKKWILKLWHPALVKIRLTSEAGPLVKYIHNGQTIASWWPQKKRFVCRKPYDLILHINDLPKDS